MRTIKVDENNDIQVSLGGVAISVGLSAVMQSCEQAVKAQLGEMIYAADEGTPNFQTVWQSGANIAQFEAAVRECIMSVDGVISVEDFEANADGNVVRYTATIKTIYGAGVLNDGV